MSHIIDDDEYSELVSYVTELRRKFCSKLENQMLIIEQQRDRIDFQQRQIDDQRSVIDELAWQIRDLRDSVRQCSEKMYAQVGCGNCQTIQRDKVSSATTTTTTAAYTGIANRINPKTDLPSPLYESINFDRFFPSKPTTTTSTASTEQVPVPQLRRKIAQMPQQQQQHELVKQPESSRRGKSSKSFLNAMLPPPPPPPPTSPPNDDNDGNGDVDDDLAHFSAQTKQKLNKLYEMRNYVRSSNATGDDPDDETNEFDEVVYRIRNFKDFSQRTQRGSSKPMCSLASDVEVDYLPKAEDEPSEMEFKEIQLRPKMDANGNAVTSNDQCTTLTQRTTYTSNVRSAIYI